MNITLIIINTIAVLMLIQILIDYIIKRLKHTVQIITDKSILNDVIISAINLDIKVTTETVNYKIYESILNDMIEHNKSINQPEYVKFITHICLNIMLDIQGLDNDYSSKKLKPYRIIKSDVTKPNYNEDFSLVFVVCKQQVLINYKR